MKKTIIALLLCLTLAPFAAAQDLTAVGSAVGIHLQQEGVTVTGFVAGTNAQAAGLQAGDLIVKIDGQKIEHAGEISDALRGGSPVRVTVRREGKQAEYLVAPVADAGRWVLGVQVRDGVSGIGTVTYYDAESGRYGALGHGVCEERGALLPIVGGTLIPATVEGVQKGARGKAGQLQGQFSPEQTLGTVEKNTSRGIFGRMSVPAQGQCYPVAGIDEIHEGAAKILSTVEGAQPQLYDVEILSLYKDQQERNLLLRITDAALLEKTGGIVQGMSGSPILQDGRLVGAVTHV